MFPRHLIIQHDWSFSYLQFICFNDRKIVEELTWTAQIAVVSSTFCLIICHLCQTHHQHYKKQIKIQPFQDKLSTEEIINRQWWRGQRKRLKWRSRLGKRLRKEQQKQRRKRRTWRRLPRNSSKKMNKSRHSLKITPKLRTTCSNYRRNSMPSRKPKLLPLSKASSFILFSHRVRTHLT